MSLDILIKNGHVIDASQCLDGAADIRVRNGTISDGIGESKLTIDASGCYVVPGLIDFHAHVFSKGSELGIPADLMLSTGVTTVVDAGSAGWANFESFYLTEIAAATCTVKALCNISSSGLFQGGYAEDYSPHILKPDKIAETVIKHRESICGLKLRYSKETVKDGDLQPLNDLMKIAADVNLPVVIHVTDPPIDIEELAARFRTGDVFCHCYHGSGATILNERGEIMHGVLAARKRGVLFDTSNGMMNFSIKVARRAMLQGFLPDIVSTDLTQFTFNKTGSVCSLPFVMSKHMALGMSLKEVVRAATYAPAKFLQLEEKIGSLKVGANADITLLKIVNKQIDFIDRFGDRMIGTQVIVPVMTIKNGRIVFRNSEFLS